MNWYLAKIVYRIVSGSGDHKAQFDEQLRLLNAPDAPGALEKAEQIGKQEALCFRNTKQEEVQWQYLHVTELYRLTEYVDGAEVSSLIRESDHPGPYMDHIDRSARQLRALTYPTLLQLI